ncbi:MAG: DNA polymerase III subunit delta [Candidatus Brocadiaceae bacterium]|nr:DNA polymerase III subunit delta [Candidatus Brocadiaceae bacterium]
MNIPQLKSLLTGEKNLPVCVVYGDEEYFIREALFLIKTFILKDSDPDIAMLYFKGDEVVVGALFDELRTKSFFATKGKLVVVEGADNFIVKNKIALEKYLDLPSKHSCLVLICNKWDKRTKLAKHIEKVGALVECLKLKDHALPGWIRTQVKQYKKTITPEGARRLAEDVGSNLSILDKQIEKLSLYLGDKTVLDEDAIDALISVDRNRTVFELTDAVAHRNVTSALKILHQMLMHGEHSVRIISLLAWQIKRLWRARQLLDQGIPESNIASELQVMSFFKNKFFDQVRLYSEADLMKKQAFLLETDIKTKTTSFDTQFLMELLVYKLCI